jgi:hypothetical protein
MNINGKYLYEHQGKLVSRQYINQLKNPERRRARQFVYLAIQWGLLIPQGCEVCGSSNAEAHHIDYVPPLKIRWLCKKHHMAEHVTT